MKNRRDFFRRVLLSAATFSFSKVFADDAKANKPADAGAKKPVSEDDSVAKALGYKHDVNKIDYAKYPQRKAPAAKNQFCESCMFFTKVDAKWGNCQIIPSGLVSTMGWCMSYAKKA